MKLRPSSLLLTLMLVAVTPFARAADSGFKSIFNGTDLPGWDGQKQFWSVRDGAITGQTRDESDLPNNTFLVGNGGEPANFELRLKFKLTAQNDKGQANSGVQYRSRITDPTTFIVGGYQADIDTGRYIGMLYEERGRGILMQPGQKIRIAAAGANSDAASEKAKKGKQKASVETVATCVMAAAMPAST